MTTEFEVHTGTGEVTSGYRLPQSVADSSASVHALACLSMSPFVDLIQALQRL